MGVANLPANQNESSTGLTEFEERIAECFAKGMTPAKIAKYMYPDDHAARRRLRRRLWHMVRRDARIAAEVGQINQAKMVIGLGPATDALIRRASKGRPDAIKLLYEASGFHNPRVKHEHTGDIKITLNSLPRPERPEVDDAIDADVVED